MDGMTLIDVFSRWAHIGAAIVLIGGSVFTRFVLMPAATGLQESEHDALRERIMGRWRKFVMGGILVLLVSGFYNYIMVAIPAHKGDGLYHGLMGTKILLGIGAFFLASVLAGRSPRFEGLREQSAKWLGILILISAIVVAIGGFLKVAVKSRPAPDSASTLQSEYPVVRYTAKAR
ncbi:MAG: hypothetical protein KDA93_15060 [Planctomycetaceae bacterium]|nr:hypothetical protein [Planctomycetaceae bacterium]